MRYEVYVEALHLDQLEDVLRDRVVCERYIQAIRGCPFLFEGKTVAALYSGCGFLTLLCCYAGARHVFDIDEHDPDNEQIVDSVIRDNGYQDRVTVVRGLIEETVLPVEKVDIIVSMWQGYCLFYENKLEKLVWFREKYLAPEGLMFPDRATFKLALIEDYYYYDRKINFWDEVYGVNMSCIKEWVLTEPIMDIVDPSVVITDTFKLRDFGLERITMDKLDFSCAYELTAMESINAHALVTWFELEFNYGPTDNVLSSSPFMPKTRWKQTIFYLKQRLELKEGDHIHGSMAMKRVKYDKCANFKLSVHHGETSVLQYFTLN